MRPILLAVEGFTSFRREVQINFSELDLFAITGATGSGKSSLLDAMTYALYGTTTRTGKQITDLLSQGATALKVQLHFAVSNAQYRITRRCRSRTGSPENKVLLEAWENNQWETLGTSITGVQKTLEQILGMDFDTFTRVIVLPQGKFDEFLKGDTAKRREILRQLAGFEIFERMRKQAGEFAKAFKQEREIVERQLMELSAPSALEVEAKQNQLNILETALPKLNQAVLTAQKLLDEEQTFFSQYSKLLKLQQELQNLEENTSEINLLQSRLTQAQNANHLLSDWALLQEARRNLDNAKTGTQSASESLNKALAQLQENEQNLQVIRINSNQKLPELKAREEALAQAKVYQEQRLQSLEEVQQAATILEDKNKHRHLAKTELEKAAKNLTSAEEQVNLANAGLQQHQSGGKALELLETVAPLTFEIIEITKQLQTEEKQLKKVTQEQNKTQETYQQQQLQLEEAAQACQSAQAALDTAEQANTEASKLNHAQALRLQLKVGDVCPVCGGTHPENEDLPELPALTMINLVPVRANFNALQKAHQNCQLEITKTETALESLAKKYQEISANLTAIQARFNNISTEISSQIGRENWQAPALQQELQALKTSDTAHRNAQQQLQTATSQLEVAQQALEFAQKTNQQKQDDYNNAGAELQRRQTLLKDCEDKLFQFTNSQPYEILVQKLEQDKQQLETNLKTAESNYQKAANQAILMEERAKQATATLEEAGVKIAQLETDWQTKLAPLNFSEESFLFAKEDIKKQPEWENLILEHRQAKLKLETKINDLTENLGEVKVNQTNLTELSQNIQQHQINKQNAETEVQQTQNQIAETKAFLTIATEKQAQNQRFIEQQTELQEREEIYHTLAQNLRANEFQAYILEHLEDELVKRATLLLQDLSEDRYALKTQEGEYWVQDNWNGGELRRVRTLSGGETFATSLSMALALSEKLAQGAQLGSLFLDEGFGTLDAETLESVTQILESLRQQSRLIGVITHIRGLAERLPAQIKVSKAPQGSHINVEIQ